MRRSPWTISQRITRVTWGVVRRVLWPWLPAARPMMLRWFGATVGQRCRLGGQVRIFIPWNLRIGDDVDVADHAILYALGTITIGDRTVLDVRAHLCAGTHDITDPRFPQIRPPIAIGSDCFIGLDAYIGPGVTLGDAVVVHPRASVHRSVTGPAHVRGNPAVAFTPDDEVTDA
jgi:putative colanic acid biosynthesis acetyltransferase WcaF